MAEDPKKKDGTLKAKYKDMPRYKVIFGYEDSFKDNFKKLSQNMSKDIVKEIVAFVKVVKKQ